MDPFIHVSGVKGRWEPRSDPFHERVDLRLQMFCDAFDRTAEWVLVARPDEAVPCSSCRSTESDEAMSDCQNCLGTGYAIRYIKTRAAVAREGGRELLVSRYQKLLQGLFPFGILDVEPRLYVSKPDSMILDRDLVLDVIWTESSCGAPKSIAAVHRVLRSQATLVDGKPMFFVSVAIEANFDLLKLNSRIASIAVIKEGQVSWEPSLIGRV